MQRTLNREVTKALREAKGITIRQLARDIHRDPGHISRVERGIHRPSDATIQAIATRLGVSMDAISSQTEAAA